MKKILSVILMVAVLIGVCISLTACDEPSAPTGSYVDRQNTKAVADSLSQSQPTPTDINFSLERFNLIRRAYWVNGQREKAASVRTISKDSKKAAALRSQLPGAKKTKEQKEAERAERRKRREEEDYRNQAFTLLLNQNPDYKKSDRLWWILLGIGFVATLVSLIITFLAPPNGAYTSVSGIVSIGSLIVAYVFIITGFVFDWIKRRPIRKETEKKLAGLSNKKIAELFAKERKAEMERNVAKAEKKANK